MGSESRGVKNSSNTPIIKKNLAPGVLGEANMDGSIFIDKSLKDGSPAYKKVVNHEMVHAKEMKEGKLSYGDDHIRYNNKTYHRKDGKIKYNGKWLPEGDKSLPWEKKANNN